MPNYTAYPKTLDTKSRKMRKGMRRTVFLANKKMTKKAMRRAEQTDKRP